MIGLTLLFVGMLASLAQSARWVCRHELARRRAVRAEREFPAWSTCVLDVQDEIPY